MTLSAKFVQEEDQFVATCDELDIVSCGDTIDEAAENLRDAVEVYLDTLEAEGERERVFRERGITVSLPKGEPEPSEPEEPRVYRTNMRVLVGV